MAAYGIDLGTTYSCIAYVDDSGRPTVVRSALGEDTIPSVVYFESPDGVVVGRAARDEALLHPNLVASLIKRQMGRAVELSFHGQRYTPESISALILKELARSAELETGQPVRDVVITHPAYFGIAEREATRQAGEIAGLRVLNLVPEPVAAALHYEAMDGSAGDPGPGRQPGEGTPPSGQGGVGDPGPPGRQPRGGTPPSGQSPGARTILVCDLGGGTFDTTVIRLESGAVTVVCTDGDHYLGGVDWDDKVSDFLVGRFMAAHPDRDPSGDEEFLQQLATDAEQLKKDLTSVESRRRSVRFEGAAEQVEVTRVGFEELTSELLRQTMEITQRTIETAKRRGVDRFHEVLLVGGATRMPAVARELEARFGFAPRLHDPDLAVAKGAARYALIESVKARLAGDGGGEAPLGEAVEEVATQLGVSRETVERLATKTVTTVAPRAFGVEVHDPRDEVPGRTWVDHLLHANDPLPRKVAGQRYYTVMENQEAVRFPIWEQAGALESRSLDHNTKIGEGAITDLPPLPEGSPLEVTFDMDEMGTLRVHAMEPSSRRDVRIELKIGGLDSGRIDEARELVSGLRVSE
jgi:molecular chaperone DnaK